MKKMMSIILLFVVLLVASCSGQEKGELTRVDVIIENQNDTHIQDEVTLALLEKTFEQIEWEPNNKANMSSKEDVMVTFFYSVEENMPERLYEYKVWFNSDTATIISNDENNGFGELNKENLKIIKNIFFEEKEYMEVRQVAWKFIEERAWTANVKEDWQGAEIKETIADNRYELLDKNYEGKKVLSVSFEDKENVVMGTPLILVDPTTKKVIGYQPGE